MVLDQLETLENHYRGHLVRILLKANIYKYMLVRMLLCIGPQNICCKQLPTGEHENLFPNAPLYPGLKACRSWKPMLPWSFGLYIVFQLIY